MNYSTLTDIRDAAISLHLDGSQHLAYLPLDVLAAAYNGTGPEFLPQQIRDLLDGACRPFLPAVMIHDVDFTFSDGSEESFKQANSRLLGNCITCACNAHPWTSWKRYSLILEAWAMYRAVSHPQFGWVAWIQAYKKRKENNMNIKSNRLIFAALLLLSACCLVTGCQTRITAEKRPEQVCLIQEKVTVNGTDQIITKDVKIASGGWYATARSPLYATEALDGLEIGVHTNGSVTMSLARYSRDLSTNSVVMVEKMLSGGAQLAIAIGDAYTKIAGGGAQADTIANLTAKAYNFFKSKGGKIDSAKVTIDESGKTFKIDDGSTCVECSPDGSCKECTVCTDCAPASN